MTEMIGVLPMGLFDIVVAGQGMLLVIVVLAIRSDQRVVNSFLALYLMAESTGLFGHFFVFSDLRVPVWMYLISTVVALSGPAIFLYVVALTRPGFRVTKSLLWHSLPFVLALLGARYSLQEQLSSSYVVYAGRGGPRPEAFLLVAITSNLISCIYVGAALWVLYRHRQRVELVYSSVDAVSLEWLKVLLCFMVSAYCLYIAVDMVQLVNRDFIFARFQINTFVSAILFYVISIGAMRQPVIFRHSLEQVLIGMEGDKHAGAAGAKPVQPLQLSGSAESSGPADSEAEGEAEPIAAPLQSHPVEKYAKSTLTEERTSAIWQQLQALMQTEKPYLDNDLTLPDLAEMLAISPQILSQVVNSQAQESFYQFINRHRVDAAKRLLAIAANRERRMLEIAEDAGFNSQSTFYSHFKKLEGVTPSKYRDSL